MGDIKKFFSGLANIASFILLQLLISNIIGKNCLVYIGAIIFLNWGRKSCILHMLYAFIIGIFVDITYHTLGVHTFSLVLLAYVKYYILVLFVPGYNRDNKVELSVKTLGFTKITIYTIICTITYYASIFVLAFFKDVYFTSGFIKNILLCSLVLLICQIVMVLIDLIDVSK